MTWITVVESGASPSGKTKIWEVYTLDKKLRLGRISWFSQWRKYAFFPEDGTIFEPTCLRDIATFLNEQTAAKTFRRKVAV